MDGATEPGVRRWADAAAAPWRNGGGVTRELASSPEGLSDFDWRISVADVTASGAFSPFPGIDRTIVLLDGAEMTVTVGDAAHALVRNQPFEFDGGLPASGSVPAGPTRDLNVMTRRSRCTAVVSVLDLEHASVIRIPGRPTQLIVALHDRVGVTTTERRRLTLDRFDLYRPPPAVGLALTGRGPVVHVALHIGPSIT